MRRLVWIDGRLAWPLVVAVVYLSGSLIVADFVWRVLVMPFDTLLICVVLADAFGAVILVAFYARFRRKRVSNSR